MIWNPFQAALAPHPEQAIALSIPESSAKKSCGRQNHYPSILAGRLVGNLTLAEVWNQ
jgi:hypothetical protein